MTKKIFAFLLIAVFICGCSSAPELPSGGNGDSEAAKWLKQAAKEGNVYAQYYYAECCFAGDGVPADRDEAFRKLKLAAAGGDTMIEFGRGNVLTKLCSRAIPEIATFNVNSASALEALAC